MPESEPDEALASIGHRVSSTFFVLTSSANGTQLEGTGKPKLVNEMQRFELWAVNLGLYHRGHSSLDYRFRDAPLLFDHALKLLRDLEGGLSHLSNVWIEDSTHSLQYNGNDTGPGDVDSFTDEDDTEEEYLTSYQSEPLDAVWLENITATVDRLYHLSFKIRNPAMRIGLSKAITYKEVDPETGIDLMAEYTKLDQAHIREVFASYHQTTAGDFVDNYLVDRLAKANTYRRQQFRYWRKRKIQFEIHSKAHSAPEHQTPDQQDHPGGQAPEIVVALPMAPSRPSTATRIDADNVNLDDSMSIISTSTIGNGADELSEDWLSIPSPPMKYDEKEFECPFCFTMCPHKLLNEKKWRAHIFRDLRPYVCTYKDCREPDQQYDSMSDWINHEAAIHGSMRQGNSQTLNKATRKCQFCLIDNVSPFHIGSHLRRVACFSLPRSSGEEGSDTGSRNSDQVEIESSEFERSQVDCLSLPGETEYDFPMDPEIFTKREIESQEIDPSLRGQTKALESAFRDASREERHGNIEPREEQEDDIKEKGKERETTTEEEAREGADPHDAEPFSNGPEKEYTYDPTPDTMAFVKTLSTKSGHIDTSNLIRILPHLTTEQVMRVRHEYKKLVKVQDKGINFAKHIRLKLRNTPFVLACYVTALGRWESEAYWANYYVNPKPSLLIESLAGRTNQEMNEIKACFRDTRHSDRLEKCITGEVKEDDFRTAMLLALQAKKQDENDPVGHILVMSDVHNLYSALNNLGNEALMIQTIMVRNDSHLREVLRIYEKTFKQSLTQTILKKCTQSVAKTLSYILNGINNRPKRDMFLIDEALREAKRNNYTLLISRLCRLHWEPSNLELVKKQFHDRMGLHMEQAVLQAIREPGEGNELSQYCIELVRSSDAHVKAP